MTWQAGFIKCKGDLQMSEKPLKPLDDERVDGVAGAISSARTILTCTP